MLIDCDVVLKLIVVDSCCLVTGFFKCVLLLKAFSKGSENSLTTPSINSQRLLGLLIEVELAAILIVMNGFCASVGLTP